MNGLNITRRIWLNKLSSDKKFKYKLTSRSVFSPFAVKLSYRLSSIFFIDSEIYKTIPIQFPRFFSLFYKKNSTLSGLFFWMSAEKQLAKQGCCTCKRLKTARNFGTKLAHLCGFWLDISFFSHMKKYRVKSIVRSSDWLELICIWNLRHSFSVGISQYVYNNE